MGCTSSTQVVTDPYTGETKTKKRLGGAYPGQRRPQHQPHMPHESQFGKDGQATVHFKAYGGGNALTLVHDDGTNQPATGVNMTTAPEYIQVTLPEGVTEGQTIHVQAPDGKLNEIVVPPGFGPGSTFTVEFARENEKVPLGANIASKPAEAVPAKDGESYSNLPVAGATSATTSTTPAPLASAPDDGFASGFGGNNNNSNPPTAHATPVYRY